MSETRRPPAVDLAAATAVGLGWTWAVAALSRSDWWHPTSVLSYYWTGVLLAVAVALRRWAPLAGFWLVLVVTLLAQRAGLQSYFHVLPLALAAFAVVRAGALAWWRAAVPAAVVGAATLVPGYPDLLLRLVPPGGSIAEILPGYGGGLTLTRNYSELVQLEAVVLVGVLLGHVFRRLESTRAELEARNAELVALQGAEAERAVTAERNRIARDLHDVVAHHVTAIVVRAQAARHVAQRRPDAGPEALDWIVAEGKEALGAMRSMVHVLRADAAAEDGVDVTLALERAADRMRAGGLDVRLEVGEHLVAAEPAVALVRIAQEALTNVALHSGAARVDVTLVSAGDRVLLTVADPGPALVPDGPRGRAGHGLGHMADRAAAVGGEVRAGAVGAGDGDGFTGEDGRRIARGWQVEAWVPSGSPAPGRTAPTGQEEAR